MAIEKILFRKKSDWPTPSKTHLKRKKLILYVIK